METEWCVARARLRELLGETPGLPVRELAERLGYSVGWVS
jgi:DNA-binding Lrp family transcriptional regulator